MNLFFEIFKFFWDIFSSGKVLIFWVMKMQFLKRLTRDNVVDFHKSRQIVCCKYLGFDYYMENVYLKKTCKFYLLEFLKM